MSDLIVKDTILAWVEAEKKTDILERVLWISRDYSYCYVYPLDEKTRFPFQRQILDILQAMESGRVRRYNAELYPFLNLPENKISDSDKIERDQRYDSVIEISKQEPAIYVPESRGVLVAKVMTSEELKLTKPTIYKRLRRFWKYGRIPNAQLSFSFNCGGPGQSRHPKPGAPKRGRPPVYSEAAGINVDETTAKNIKATVMIHYATADKPSLDHAYHEYLKGYGFKGHHLEDGVKVPDLKNVYISPGQFNYHARKDLDIRNFLRKRNKGLYDLNNRPILGNSTQMAYGPGAIYMIDATEIDMYILSRYNRLPAGRPTLYLVADVFSHMIVGFYLTLKKPSWQGMMMALYYTLRDKVALCAEYGITITPEEWPVNQLGDELFGDRGEAIAMVTDHVASSMPMDISNTPPYRPDLKGLIEQYFRTVKNKAVKKTPGSVEGMFRHILRRKYPLDACLDMYQLTKMVIRFILLKNHSTWLDDYPLDEMMIADQVEPRPITLWNYGVINRSGCLRDIPLSVAQLNLLPTAEAVVTPEGLRVGKCYYTNPRADKDQWFLRLKGKSSENIWVSYDPRLPEIVYYPSKGGGIEAFNLIEDDHWKRYRGYYEEEIIQAESLKKSSKAKHEVDSHQAEVAFLAHKDAIIRDGKRQTQAAYQQFGLIPTDGRRLQYMEEVKKALIRDQDKKEAWVLGETPQLADSVDKQSSSVERNVWQTIEDELLDETEVDDE